MAAKLIIWVLEIHEPSLLFDLDCRLSRRQPRSNPPVQEQADKLPLGCRDFLADHDSLPAEGLKPNCTDSRVVIGQENGIEAESPASVSNQFGFALRVERCRAMDVQIDTN